MQNSAQNESVNYEKVSKREKYCAADINSSTMCCYCCCMQAKPFESEIKAEERDRKKFA
jgi:hypothetical protein